MIRDLHLGDGHNLGTRGGDIALDCSVRETRHEGIFSISTTDFFFPLVASPYLQGRIGAANVLSDLYAEGVQDIDFVLMLLAVCRDMSKEEQDICTHHMIKGFQDACAEAGAPITGGQTVMNPWPIIGGVATSIVSREEFVKSDGGLAGDVVVLTKPLGTQVAVNVHQWKAGKRKIDQQLWSKCEGVISVDEADDLMHEAVCSMARLNKNAAKCMLDCKARAATDITGFGVLGHAQNLVTHQREEVGMELHTLPCLKKACAVNDTVFDFQLKKGYSAETSGGLLVCLPSPKVAEEFIQKIKETDGTDAWIVGRLVEDPDRKARFTDDMKILEV